MCYYIGNKPISDLPDSPNKSIQGLELRSVQVLGLKNTLQHVPSQNGMSQVLEETAVKTPTGNFLGSSHWHVT